MNKRVTFFVLAIVFNFTLLFSQVASNLKVSVKDLKTYTPPNLLENPDLKALPREEEWIKPPYYLWFVMNGKVSKNTRFPTGCSVDVQNSSDGSIQIKKGNHVFQITELKDLEEIVSSPDGSMVMLYYTEVYGDVSRYSVWLVDLEKNKKEKITSNPVGLAEFSPDSKFIIMEGLTLIDAKVDGKKRTSVFLGEFAYPEVLGWSKDGRKLILVSYENWENPQYAKKYLISFK